MRGAIIAAIVAAFVSATSATAALVVTSKQIKDGTIQTVDISAKAKRALKGNRGPRGFEGAEGPQGPPGPAGTSLTYTNAYSDRVAVPPGSFRFVNAICPASTAVVGGAFATDRVSEAKLIPTNSYPVGMGDGRGAWYVVMHNVGSQEEVFWATAYCVSSS